MIKTLMKLPILALATALIIPATAEAQGRTPHRDSAAVGGDIGIFLPREDALEPAVTLDGFYEYYFTPRTSLRLGLGVTAPEFEFEPDESLRFVRIGGDIIYNWERGAIHPFVGGGLGVYMLQPRENGNNIFDSESKLGAVALGGVEFFTSDTFSIKAEGSYHMIGDVDEFGDLAPGGLKLAVGVKKYF